MDTETQEQMNEYHRGQRRGRIVAGVFLLLVGVAILCKQLAFPFVPTWVFSWPMILIVVGLFVGLKHGFRGGGWLVLLVLGGIFLADYIDPRMDLHRFTAPAIIIAIGLMFILRPRSPRPHWNQEGWQRWEDRWQRRYERRHGYRYGPGPSGPPYTPDQPTGSSSTQSTDAAQDDYLDAMAIFGGTRRVIMSKNFKGGEATSVLGGTELDLTQADINGTVTLELTQVLGGAKLIVPSHWTIRNEVNAVFGGVDDKRQLQTAADPNKVLVLRGTSFMGGLEIRNF